MSVEDTLKERGNRYGDFSDHARICQAIKQAMFTEDGWHRLSAVQKQALEVIADKQARILSGDPNYADNWHDIQGYAKLVEDRLPKEDTRKLGWSKMHEAPYALTSWTCNHGLQTKTYESAATASANCPACAQMTALNKVPK